MGRRKVGDRIKTGNFAACETCGDEQPVKRVNVVGGAKKWGWRCQKCSTVLFCKAESREL